MYQGTTDDLVRATGEDVLRELAADRNRAHGNWVWAQVKAVYAEAGVRFDWPPVARLLLGLSTPRGQQATR